MRIQCTLHQVVHVRASQTSSSASAIAAFTSAGSTHSVTSAGAAFNHIPFCSLMIRHCREALPSLVVTLAMTVLLLKLPVIASSTSDQCLQYHPLDLHLPTTYNTIISSPYGVPYDFKAADMPPTYLDNIPMTATRKLHPDIDDEAMPYRPRERSMEKAFRQLCCGSCWGFCAWIAGIVVLLTGIIVVAVVLVSNSKHSAAVVLPVSNRTFPAQLPSTTAISSPLTSLITITASSQQPSISISISTISPLQPSTVMDAASQASTSTVTMTQTYATTSTVSPPQTQTVTQSLSESLTTLTTTSVSTASRDSSSSSSLTSLIQTINASPEARLPLSPPCFVSFLNDVAPGIYTGQSWTTVGTYEFFSTAGGVPTQDALMTYTGVELGATTTLWPLCGQYTLSTYSVAVTAVAPTMVPTITRTSVIVVTRPTSTVLPLQQQHTLLPTPSHVNLAISHRRPANTTPSASGNPSKPAITSSTSERAVLIPPIHTPKSGYTTPTEATTYTLSVLPHTTASDWKTRTRQRDVIAQSIPTKRTPRQMADRSPAQANPQQQQHQHEYMGRRPTRKMNPGIIVAIVLGSLIVVIAAIGLANRWFRHGYL